MKKIITIVIALILIPTFVSAATLTSTQVSAIIGLLQAFGVSQTTIAMVQSDLEPQPIAAYIAPVAETFVSLPTQQDQTSLPVQDNSQTTMEPTEPAIVYVQGVNPDGTTYATNIPLDTSTTTTYQTSSTDTITIAPDGTVISRTRNVRRSNVLGPLTPDEVAAMNN